jgi:hypothetical protein
MSKLLLFAGIVLVAVAAVLIARIGREPDTDRVSDGELRRIRREYL